MGQKYKMLVLDDDYYVRKAVAGLLKLKGYMPVEAETGKIALERLEEERPVVAILDIMLPDISGLEVLRRIRKDFPEIESIMLTGQGTKTSAIEAVNMGAFGFIEKPYEPEELLEMIKKAIKKRNEQLELRNREIWFQLIKDNTSDAVVAIESDGLICMFSPSAEDIFGYRKDEILGQPSEILMPDQLRERHRKALERYFSKGETTGMIGKYITVPALHKNGSIFSAAMKLSGSRYEEKNIVLATIRDLTDWKEKEEEIERLLMQNDLILNSINEAVLGFTSEGKILFVNKSVLELTGWELHELKGKSFHEVFHHSKEDGSLCESISCPLFESFKSGEIHSGIHKLFWKKECKGFPVEYRVIPVKRDGIVSASVIAFRDISKKRYLEGGGKDIQDYCRKFY